MNKEKITHSFEINGGAYCGECKFRAYIFHGDYYICKIFNKKLRKQVKDIYIEILRCQKCKTAGEPVRRKQGEK